MTTGVDRRGLQIAVASFVLWGVMPLYWHLLKAVPSLQITLHRILWSAVLVCAWLGWTRRGWLRATLAQPRAAGLLALSGVLIGGNWGLYIWAVNAGHVVEASLGYFINPLLNVVLGVLVFRERLTRLQTVSVALAALGVLWLTWRFGAPPWIALALAGSFAAYGLIRKVVAVESVGGLAVESLYLVGPAVALIAWSQVRGTSDLAGAWWPGLDLLLVLSGALTALPLIGFAYAVRRVPLSTVGLLQYIAPTLQFLIGVLVFHEAFDRDRAIGFACIWLALALFAGESAWRSGRATPR
ncbi:EamA family transporter RarD [Lysobacter humi (ex Lee et al. 2017)]